MPSPSDIGPNLREDPYCSSSSKSQTPGKVKKTLRIIVKIENYLFGTALWQITGPWTHTKLQKVLVKRLQVSSWVPDSSGCFSWEIHLYKSYCSSIKSLVNTVAYHAVKEINSSHQSIFSGIFQSFMTTNLLQVFAAFMSKFNIKKDRNAKLSFCF